MNKTYRIEKSSTVEALNNIDDFIEGITKINKDEKAREYNYTIGIDPIDGTPSKCAIILTLDRNEGSN